MEPDRLRSIYAALAYKWNLEILGQLVGRPLRYSEIKHQVHELDDQISESVLSRCLARLHTNGLVSKTTIDRHPVYQLTNRGRRLVELGGKIEDVD